MIQRSKSCWDRKSVSEGEANLVELSICWDYNNMMLEDIDQLDLIFNNNNRLIIIKELYHNGKEALYGSNCGGVN